MPIEDFHKLYVELDPSSKITKSHTRVTANSLPRNEVAYVYKDFGKDYFKDIIHLFEIFIGTYDANSECVLYGVENNLGDYAQCTAAGLAGFHALIINTENKRYLYFKDNDSHSDSNATIGINTLYYPKITRVGTTVSMVIYTDAARTNILDTVSITTSAEGLRYLYPLMGDSADQADQIFNGYSQNYDLQEGHPYTKGGTYLGSMNYGDGTHLRSSNNGNKDNLIGTCYQ